MAQDDSGTVIWLTETHTISGRAAVVEDDGRSCWLYLLAHHHGGILKSVLVYSVGPAIGQSEVRDSARSGDAPMLTARYASNRAVVSERYPDDFSFRWRPDGEAVAVLFREEVYAIIAPEEKHGFSIAISTSGPFGSPLVLDRHRWL